MSPLQDSLHVVLQTQQSDGSFWREGFNGIPIVNPAFIGIVTDGDPESLHNAEILREALTRVILELSPDADQTEVPCPDSVHDPLECHALKEDDCEKLLVVVATPGDVSSSSRRPPAERFPTWAVDWLNRSPKHHLLPVMLREKDGKERFPDVFPSPMSDNNGAFWGASVTEAVPWVLAAAGLTDEEFRVFISYRRTDTQPLADQLFDALTRDNFDVFLDRFTLQTGVPFQKRLTQELADKAMVVILESEQFLESEWTQHEINFAKEHRLGLFVVQVPDGVTISGIDPSIRRLLDTHEYNANAKSAPLDAGVLREIVLQIREEHAKAMVRRRYRLRTAMHGALLKSNAGTPVFGPGGLIYTTSTAASPEKHYAVWTTGRPPATTDFQHAHSCCPAGAGGIVLGPLGALESRRKCQVDWLSGVAAIACFDEGELGEVAGKIAGGLL